MIRCDRSSWVSRLPPGRRGVGRAPGSRPGRGRRRSGRTARARRRGAARPSAASRRPGLRTGAARPASRQGRPQARVERARPEARFVHDPEAVGEPRVLGGREDPAGALELADPAQPLEPGRVEQVLLGDLLVGQPGRRRLVRRQPLGQLHVPVDRVADEVDRGERLASHARSQGTQIRSSDDHAPSCRPRSRAATRTP